MKGIGYFQNLVIFFGFFWEFFRNFFGGIYLEEFFGRNFLEGFFLGGFFWEDFFGRIFWKEFFWRNYLVEINKELMFLSRFCLNAQGRTRI